MAKKLLKASYKNIIITIGPKNLPLCNATNLVPEFQALALSLGNN